MTFPDHFSDHAHRYEAYRPTYPDALFSYLASLVAAHNLALIRQPGDAALRAHWQCSLCVRKHHIPGPGAALLGHGK